MRRTSRLYRDLYSHPELNKTLFLTLKMIMITFLPGYVTGIFFSVPFPFF
jgi:hypothetical protein